MEKVMKVKKKATLGKIIEDLAPVIKQIFYEVSLYQHFLTIDSV